MKQARHRSGEVRRAAVVIAMDWPGLMADGIDTSVVDTTNVTIDIPRIEMSRLDFGPSK